MTSRTIALLSALNVASAGRPSVALPTADIPASSKLGSRILSSSRQLDNNDNQSWIAGYSIRFEKCATSEEYYGGSFGGEENNDNQNNYNYNGMYKQRLVHYKLCPTGNCDTCSGGADYVIDMGLFVEAFIESKLEAQEYNCEQVKENCYYDDEYQCYAQAGLDYCMDDENENNNNNENQVEFQLEDAAECQELEVDEEALQYFYYSQQSGNDDQQNYNYNQNGNQNQEMKLYMGPYCSDDGQNIFLATFMDEMCQYPTPAGTYEKFSYGQALPYSEDSLIDSDCLSCKEPQDQDQNNQDDQEDEDEVIEMCERLYEDAGKCESGLSTGVTYYPNTYACEFIETLQAPGGITSESTFAASKVFAGIFAATTLVLAGVAYAFHTKGKRNNVDLSSSGGGALA